MARNFFWGRNPIPSLWTACEDGLTLILLTWRIWWAANNASKWQMGFNSVFKSDKECILLLLALQPTMGFSLLSDSLPFCSFFALRTPPSYSHYLHIFFDMYTHLFLGLPLILVTIGFHSNILLGVLSSSIRITWPSQAILLLSVNLTMRFLLVRAVRNSFWFSRIHLHVALGQRFLSVFYAQIFWDVVRLDLSVSKLQGKCILQQ